MEYEDCNLKSVGMKKRKPSEYKTEINWIENIKFIGLQFQNLSD